MPALIVFVGGTMDTERLWVTSAAVSQLPAPEQEGLPSETYVRLDPIHRVPVRFGLNPDHNTLANPEGRSA